MRTDMLFWPLVVVSLVVVSLFLAGPPSGSFLDEGGRELRGVYAIVFAAGITFAGAGRVLMRGGARSIRYAFLWCSVFAATAIGYTNWTEITFMYERMRGTIHPSVAMSTAQGEAELRRAWDGQYRAEADLNGVRMRLMVDTGASMVLIPYEDVHKLGINPDSLDYSLPVTTANGKSTVAPIRISSIKIGPIAVFDVQAAVAHPGRLKIGLLGMSFLDKLSETSFRRDKLILRN